MDDKLKILTERIYQEGVDKAEKESSRIIEEAKSKASKIISDAEAKAKLIVDNAEKESKSLKRNIESEIKLSARQALNALKQNISDLIITEFSNEEITKTLSDKDFIKRIIEKLIQNFNEQDASANSLDIILSANEQSELEAYFRDKVKSLFDKKITVNFSDKIDSGFEISPGDNSYKISFTDETFEAYFKNYLRPRSIKLLYGDK
jgi:V/A-type H+/Na+-transporting ATPase subunit E